MRLKVFSVFFLFLTVFREYINLVVRQLACGASEPIVSKMLLDFVDVLSPLLGLSGQSWTILGVLGFSSKYIPPPRAKFLALSITYFVYSCVLEGPSLKTRGYVLLRGTFILGWRYL